MTGGKFFESLIVDRIHSIYGKGCTFPTEEDDREKGTDLFLYRLPVDVTLRDFWEKTGDVIPLGDLGVDDIFTLRVGKRMGNGHVLFEEPVLVLSFDLCLSPHEFKDLVWTIDKDVLEECIDLFWD